MGKPPQVEEQKPPEKPAAVPPVEEPPAGPKPARGDGLRGAYFANMELKGAPVAVRVDPMIGFDWGSGSPLPGLPRDYFSVRWTGWIVPPRTGTFTFFTKSDDGVRLWINEKLLLGRWIRRGSAEDAAQVNLRAWAPARIRMEYFDNAGVANMTIFWSGPGGSKEIVPPGVLYSDDPGSMRAQRLAPPGTAALESAKDMVSIRGNASLRRPRNATGRQHARGHAGLHIRVHGIGGRRTRGRSACAGLKAG